MVLIGKKLFETSRVLTTGLGGFFVTNVTKTLVPKPHFSVITDGRSPDELHQNPKDGVTEISLEVADT